MINNSGTLENDKLLLVIKPILSQKVHCQVSFAKIENKNIHMSVLNVSIFKKNGHLLCNFKTTLK